MRIMMSAALLALALGACEDPDTVAALEAQNNASRLDGPPIADGQVQVAQAPALPAATGPEQTAATIDWDAARQARSGSSITDAQVSVQNTTGNAAPEVPVLLPSGIVQAQNARPPAMVTTGDGYFATYEMPRYDAIVNGTKSVYGAQRAARGEEMTFTAGEASAQLAFARFGADYLIEFECRQVDGGESCITEPEARAFADSLFVAQTR